MPPKKAGKTKVKSTEKSSSKGSKKTSKTTKKQSNKKESKPKQTKTNKSSKKNLKDTEELLETTQTSESSTVQEEEENEEQSIVSTEELMVDSESENKECGLEKVINDDMDYFNEDDSSEIETSFGTVVLEKDQRITNPRLTRYEMVRILGERTKQLTMGAKPLVKNYQELTYEQIAIEELKHNMVPFKIKRPLPNNRIEEWSIEELDKKHLMNHMTY